MREGSKLGLETGRWECCKEDDTQDLVGTAPSTTAASTATGSSAHLTTGSEPLRPNQIYIYQFFIQLPL